MLANEGVRIQSPLFHATTEDSSLTIVKEGINARRTNANPDKDGFIDNAVCFTRNLDYVKSGLFGHVIFIMDEKELKNIFKTYTYDNRYKHQVKRKLEAPVSDRMEFETRVSLSPGKFNPNADAYCLFEKTTIIPPKYIKAMLIVVSLNKEYVSHMVSTGIPVFLYSGNKYFTTDTTQQRYSSDSIIDTSTLSFSELVNYAEDTGTPTKILKQLSTYRGGNNSAIVRGAVASNPSTPVDVLLMLAEDREGYVRARVSKNPNTPIDVLNER